MRFLLRTIIVFSLFVLIPQVVNAALPGFMLKKMGTMQGRLVVEGEPLANGIVSLFKTTNGLPPIGENMRRVPEFLSRTDAEGAFSVKLAAGEYYIGMLKRDVGAPPGPPREGERFYFVGDENNSLRKLSIKEREEIDIGTVEGLNPDTFKETSDLFTVEGVLVNGYTGKPHKGALVMAKTTLSTPRPDYISNRTKDDGMFRLNLMAGSSYFLIARSNIAASRPRPGDAMGTYGIHSAGNASAGSVFGASPPPGVFKESDDQPDRALAVTGGTGEVVSGIEIKMFEVPNPQKIKESLQGTTDSPKFESGAKLNNILFATNSHQLEKSSIPELDRWVEFLTGRKDVSIELSGHTDSVGDENYNQQLSEKRVEEIANYLVNKGVDASRITTRGYGESKPVADNSTAEGRKKNRRVEIKFSK